ncbi:MAG: hypothetical protein JXA30_11880 [Deltaproteobacteria bacterium]|nr:hypothetical protein [Deltaproteobacteria bacterium]
MTAAFGCGGDDGNSPEKSGSGGDSESGGSDDSGDSESGGIGGGGTGGGGGDNGELPDCPAKNPPLDDPYCLNSGCPYAVLKDLDPNNRPMGDCCNTVDIARKEQSMSKGETYDLEFATMIYLPQLYENVANEMINKLVANYQTKGADVTLVRFRDVPRTEDMTEPVPVTVEISSGKVNCDGSFSFYGPNGAPPPVHDGPPNDPGRWKKHVLEVNYNGFDAAELTEKPSEEVLAQASGLTWAVRWKETRIDYEQPIKFLWLTLKNNPDNWSCYGSMDLKSNWDLKAELRLFIPVEEMKQTILPDLADQSQCGLFAMGAYAANECDDLPQDQWGTKPNGYCDADDKCWLGDPNDAEYADFWEIFYDGEDGCGGEEHPCCDPAGLDTALEPCNAFYMREGCAIAAVDITDEDSDDPDKANSYITNCQ